MRKAIDCHSVLYQHAIVTLNFLQEFGFRNCAKICSIKLCAYHRKQGFLLEVDYAPKIGSCCNSGQQEFLPFGADRFLQDWLPIYRAKCIPSAQKGIDARFVQLRSAFRNCSSVPVKYVDQSQK